MEKICIVLSKLHKTNTGISMLLELQITQCKPAKGGVDTTMPKFITPKNMLRILSNVRKIGVAHFQ